MAGDKFGSQTLPSGRGKKGERKEGSVDEGKRKCQVGVSR